MQFRLIVSTDKSINAQDALKIFKESGSDVVSINPAPSNQNPPGHYLLVIVEADSLEQALANYKTDGEVASINLAKNQGQAVAGTVR